MRATWPAGTTAGASRWMPRCASTAPTAAAWSACYATAHAPPFALQRLGQVGDDQLVYRFAKPLPDGRTELRLTPLELIERLAALIPPPRLHRHRYHGVLAPHSPLRAQVIALARPPPASRPEAAPPPHAPVPSPARYVWALLLARLSRDVACLVPPANPTAARATDREEPRSARLPYTRGHWHLRHGRGS
jgi:hypothetical protein